MSVTIQVNALSGTANASGAGPATALTGSNASYSGTTVTLDGSPSLGSVATDGTHVLYLQTSTGRRFFTITGVNDGADTVTVSETIAGTASGLSWAIGGKCSSINTYLQVDVKEGWIIELGSNLDISSSLAFNISNFVIKSDVENVVRKIRATGCDAMVFTPAAHNKQLTLQNVKCVTAKSHPSRYYNFDGTDDYVRTGIPTSNFKGSTQGTVSAWISTTSSNTQRVFHQNTSHIGGYTRLALVLVSGEIRFAVLDDGQSEAGGVSVTVEGTTVNDGNWHHVLGTFGTNGVSIYVNGVLIDTDPTQVTTHNTDSYEPPTIGALERTLVNFFAGGITDVRVYSEELDFEEVQAVYQGRSISKTLVAHYKCSDQDDNEAYDSGPNSYHGLKRSITPASFHGEDEPFLTNQFPTVLKFDGVDDVATYSVAHSNPLATAMGWFYIASDAPAGCYLLTQPAIFSVKEDLLVVNQASPLVTKSVATNFPKDKWFFMTCVADGTDLKVYIDGTFVRSIACGPLDNLSSNWQVSRNIGYLKGSVGPCRVYDQALTQSEIVSIYNGGKITKKPIIQVGFNEGTGSTTEDEISADRFDLTGSPVWYKKAPYNSNTSDYNGIKVAEGNFNDNYLNLVGCVLGDEDEVLKKGLVSYDPNVVCRINNCNIQYCEDGIDSQSMLVGAYNWIHNNTRYGLLTDQSVGISHSLFSKNAYGIILKDAAMASVQGTHNTFVDNGVASGRLVDGTVVTSGYSSSTALVPTSSRDFDGVDDYLTAGNVLNPLHKDFSVAAWIKSQNDVAMFGPVVGKQDSTDAAHRFYLGQDYDGKVLAGIEGSANATVQSRARTFNGSSDYITLGGSSLISRTSVWSVSLWVKPDTTTGTFSIFQYGNSASDRNGIIVVNGYLKAGYYNGSSYNGVGQDGVLPLNQWTHIVMTNNEGVVDLFVNGTNEATAYALLSNLSTSNKTLGYTNNTGHYFDGQMLDFQLWNNKVLSVSEVYSLYKHLSLKDKPNLHYKLDDPVASRVLDSSGNGNHGTPVGTTVYTGLDVPTKVNSYSGKLITRYKDLGFDGHVQIADDAAFNLSTNVSASIWAKNHNTSLPASQILISKNGTSQQEWTLYILASKKIRVVLSSDGSTAAVWETTSAYSGDISKWHHYAFTYNSSTTKIYVDGVELAASYVSGSHPASLFNGTAPVELGSHYNTTFNWMGSLADGKIYSQTLTANEVLEDYADQLPYTPVGRWKLDDLDPNTAVDSGSGGNDATSLSNIRVRVENQVVSYIPKDESTVNKDVLGNVVNQTEIQANVYHPLERFDPERKCYVFDGTNDYIDSGYNAGTITQLSIALWVKSTVLPEETFVGNDRNGLSDRGFSFRKDYVGISGKLQFFASSDGSNTKYIRATAQTNVCDGNWHHIAMSFDAGTVKIFVDGVDEELTDDGIDPHLVTQIYNNTQNFVVGVRPGGANSEYEGSMADIRVWSGSIITPDQVKKIYQQQDYLADLPIPTFWYKCDDTGRYALDASGNSYHGTKTNIQTSFHATDSALPFKPAKKTYNNSILHSFSKGAASWNSIAGVSATSGQTNWDGASDAYLLENTSIGGRVLWFRTVPQKCNGVKISVVVKDIDAGPLVRILLRNNTEAVNYVSSDTDVSTLTAGAFAEVVSLGNSWAKITVTKYGEMDPGDEIWFYLYCGTSASATGTQIYYGQVEIEMLQESPVNAALPYQNVDGDLFDVGQNRLQPCLTFDGINDYVTPASFSITGNWTIAFWKKHNYSAGSIQYLVSFSSTCGIFCDYHASQDSWGFYDGTTTLTNPRLSYDWTHLAVTKTGTTYEFFVNGKSLGSQTALDKNISGLNIGRRLDGIYPFSGSMVGLKIYDSVLSDEDIERLSLGLDTEADPYGDWPMTEGIGTRINDVSPNNNFGTMPNFTESLAWANLQGVYDYNSSYGCKFGIDVDSSVWTNGSLTITENQTDPNGGSTASKLVCTTTGANNIALIKTLKGGLVTDLWVKNVSGNRMELGFYNGSTFNRCFGEILSGPGDIQYVSNRFQVYNLTSDWTHIRVWSNMDTTGLYLYPGRYTSGSDTDAVVVAFWEVYPTYAAVPYLLDMSAPADGSSILARSGKQLGIAGNAGLLPVAQSPRTVRSTTTVNDGAWHHIAATADRNGVLSVYVDGTLEGTVNIGSLGNTALQSLQDFTIGRLGSYFFPGKIGGVQFYDSALSASDVLALSQGTQPLDPTSSWSMVSSGSVEGDSGVAGNSAVINGTTLKTIGPRTASNDCVSLIGSNFTDNANGIGFNGSPLVLYTNSYGNENADVGTSQSTVGNTTAQPRYTDSTNDKYTPSRTLKDKGPDKIGQDGTTEANLDQGGPQRSEQRVPIVRRNGMNLNM